jgi:hypothetical protein
MRIFSKSTHGPKDKCIEESSTGKERTLPYAARTEEISVPLGSRGRGLLATKLLKNRIDLLKGFVDMGGILGFREHLKEVSFKYARKEQKKQYNQKIAYHFATAKDEYDDIWVNHAECQSRKRLGIESVEVSL